jgi:hypothetical protein
MKGKDWGCITIVVLVILVTLYLFIFQRGLGLIHWFLYTWYSNPVSWISIILGIAFLITGAIYESSDRGGPWSGISYTLGIVMAVFWTVWLFISGPVMMVGLYNNTVYEQTELLIPVSQPRPVSYAEASTNFHNQNPEARFGPGDLDFVRGRWTSELGPATMWNKLFSPTQGIFVYDANETDKVKIIRQVFPFAESGYLWNSDDYFVHQIDPFVEFHETLYLKDPDGGYMAMISTIKRKGFARVPYLYKVLLIHADGETEWLSPRQAMKDERLEGVQLIPEWLEKKKVDAFGWRYGVFQGLFYKTGRVQVQESTINSENNAPYHLQTPFGMVWFTPYGPYGKDSLKGIMMQDSHDTISPVYIWSLSEDQAWQGLDALATEIKGAPDHPGDINWLRLSSVEGGTARSGDTDVIEMIPVPRMEEDGISLYFMGYVAIDPPVKTRFYAIINAGTREVLEDVFYIDQVTAWLNGEIELEVQTKSSRTSSSQEQVPAESVEVPSDFADLTDDELFSLMQNLFDELKRRSE